MEPDLPRIADAPVMTALREDADGTAVLVDDLTEPQLRVPASHLTAHVTGALAGRADTLGRTPAQTVADWRDVIARRVSGPGAG